MKQGDTLFVYGTLRPGERADLRNSRRVTYIGPDRINGLLYHLGSYPGAIFEPQIFNAADPIIVGDVFRIRDNEAVAILDAYEGYPSLYGRGITYSEKGREVWVYNYRPSVAHLEPLRVGDWSFSKIANMEQMR